MTTVGCFRINHRSSKKTKLTLPAQIADQLKYNKYSQPVISETICDTNKGYRLITTTILSEDEYLKKDKRLILDSYIPYPGSNMPVIMVLPVSGGDYTIEKKFIIKYFASKGYACVLVRRDKKSDPNSGKEINAMIKQSILDNKRVLDWMESRSEFDHTRIVAFGTSLGAIKLSLLIGTDERIKASVLLLVTGDFPYLASHSKEGSWRTGGATKKRNAYLTEHKMTISEMEKDLRNKIYWDPNLVAPYVDPEKVLIFLGMLDTVTPFSTGKELRQKMGKPDTVFLLSGHYTALLYLTSIRSSALTFFEEHIGKK